LNCSGTILYDNFLFARLHQINAAGNIDVGGGNFAYMQSNPLAGPHRQASRASGNMGMLDQQQLNNAFFIGTLGLNYSYQRLLLKLVMRK
jgi:hypothetical protein